MLATEHLTGVALDVFTVKPPGYTHPNLREENFPASPHAMTASQGAMRRIFKLMADDMVEILESRQPQFVANPRADTHPGGPINVIVGLPACGSNPCAIHANHLERVFLLGTDSSP